MTAACGGGTSSAQTQFGTAVAVGVASIAATLNNVPTPLAMLAAGYIGAVNYELSTFCTSDPPAMPTITGGDWAALITVSDPVAHLAAQQKFQDMLANYFWPVFCKCDTTGTPAQPALPTPPSDLPTANPVQLPTAPTGGNACWSSSVEFPIVGNLFQFHYDKLLWNDGSSFASQPGNNTRALPNPPPTELVFTGVLDSSGANPDTACTVRIDFLGSGGAVLSSAQGATSTMSSVTVTSFPTGTLSLQFNVSGQGAQSGTVTGGVVMSCTMFCAGQSPNSPAAPCCPPDPSLQATLNAIYSLVKSIYEGSPTPLTSYADGTAHAGLSGNGTVTLVESAPLAVRVNITADSANLGQVAGDPVYLFDRGYIVPIVNSAPVRAVSRLVFNPQMFVLPALTEQIGYSLGPGVTVTITELTAGP